ncbi:hypothetical protein EYF80_015405 [Liparis tanakae]|uniref:Uncharacterized protein n=1 Tax=Liparis tanakae TaxID=230148 RepID=A0A4Z2IAA2_9TELE|nr:hypothetical protein EYF80_015405 [Liparis tanakae]
MCPDATLRRSNVPGCADLHPRRTQAWTRLSNKLQQCIPEECVVRDAPAAAAPSHLDPHEPVLEKI